MSTTVLNIENITKRFGDQEVLQGVSLELHSNEVVALIGHSGSGKSTLLRCANLLEPVSSGTISLFGQALQDTSIDEDAVRRHIGMVFQSYNLFPHLSVLDNVMLGPVYSLKESKDSARQRALELLERIGLASRAEEFPDRLSGGQQQRVAIVRSLAMRPALLLLDEVTSALDPTLVGEVLDLLRELATAGTTMLIATHEMGFCREVATRVAFLHQGRLLEIAPAKELFESPQHEETKRFLERVS